MTTVQQEVSEEIFIKLGLLQCQHSRRRINRTCNETNLERFNDAYYACPKTVHDIFIDIQSPELGCKRIEKPKPSHLLLALRFLKKYPTKYDLAGIANATEKTALCRVWRYVQAIQALKDRKVSSSKIVQSAPTVFSSFFRSTSGTDCLDIW